MKAVNAAFWRGRRVLVTGHTGFKGAWLTLWLQELGAEVVGLARKPPTEPSLFVRTMVTSRPAPDRIIFDVGFKSLPTWHAMPR